MDRSSISDFVRQLLFLKASDTAMTSTDFDFLF